MFSKNYAKISGGAIFASNYKHFNMTGVTFDGNYAKDRGSELYALFSNYKTFLDTVTIRNPSPVTSLYFDSISVEGKFLNIYQSTGTSYSAEGGGITCINCKQLKIYDSSFTGLRAQLGGAVYLEQSDSLKSGTLTSANFIVKLLFNIFSFIE